MDNINYGQILFEKYGTALLSTKQTSEVIGRSVLSLEADRRNGTGLEFKRVGGKPNSPVKYPVHVIAKYIEATEKTL